MASTFANRGTAWRVRSGGNELNGGGFDQFVTGVGVDYSDSDTAVIDSTTGTCAVAAATTFIDNSATFPSDIVGNVLRASARTGGTAAALDYFVVTGYTNANTITLDRAMAVTTDITAMTYRIGGAHPSLINYASAATGTLGTPVLATPLLAGNQIYIRGSGSEDPASADFDWSSGHWTITSGSRANGMISIIGYNGRPRIDHDWAVLADHVTVKHISLRRKVGAAPGDCFVKNGATAARVTMTDCILDQNGFDSTEFDSFGGSFCYNEVRNSGGGALGTRVAVVLSHPCNQAVGNYIHNVRGHGISTGAGSNITSFPSIGFNTIVNCLGDGVVLNIFGSSYFYAVFNNTINNNGGHGINAASGTFGNAAIFNNIISNHTGSGKFGISFVDSITTNRRLRRSVFEFNCYYGNTNNFNQVSSADTWAVQTNDITSDPGYVNAASGNYATGANVRSKGLSGLGGLNGTLGAATNKVNIGAFQGAAAVVTIPCTVGNAVANGTTAAITRTIATTVGNSAADGATANLIRTIATTVGNATADGITAAINRITATTVGNAVADGSTSAVTRTVATTPGNAAAAGIIASIVLDGSATIACTPGNAVADGSLAAVTRTVATTLGNAVADGLIAGLIRTIATTTGNAVADGITASITTAGQTVIGCTPGNAVADGAMATVMRTITADPGNAVTNGSIAALLRVIAAGPGNAVADGVTASILGATSIACFPGNAVAQGILAHIASGSRLFVNDISVLSVPISNYISTLSAPSKSDLYVR